MQEKVVFDTFDTRVYIGVFNRSLFKDEIKGFNKVMYLVHPGLHELWIGARGKREINHLINFGARFIKLGRLVVPSSATQVLIGQVCQRLRSSGRLDPAHLHIYNDVCIALLARQIGATVVTVNVSDFEQIQQVVEFQYREVMKSGNRNTDSPFCFCEFGTSLKNSQHQREWEKAVTYSRGIDPVHLLNKAAKFLGCNLARFRQSVRISNLDKEEV